MQDARLVKANLRWFVKKMQEKLLLPKNMEKVDWRDLKLRDNLLGIENEYRELQDAYNRLNSVFPTRTPNDVIEECVDVANRAMMLADQLNSFSKKK